MKNLILSIAAAGVLVAGAFVASSLTATPAEAQTTDSTTEGPVRPARGAILDDVLDGLVADGTLDTSQAEAVKDGLEAKHEELVDEFGDRRPASHFARRGLLRGLLADDVISADEIAALPDDHPLRTGESPLAELLEDDGQITRDEFEAFVDDHRPFSRERDADAG